MGAPESVGFLRSKGQPAPSGCCHSKSTKNCCFATGVFGIVCLGFGVVLLLTGKDFLTNKILESMALTEGSSRLESWLRPPVQPHLEAYAFHISNPEEVLEGKKPELVEKGPYVYKAITLKDTDDNMKWFGEGSRELSYRPRKLYIYVPELSGEGLDPDNDYMTFPNIPYWTTLHKFRHKTGFAASIAHGIVTDNGLAEPFINVTFSGLLWGYEDELPCLPLKVPAQCADDGSSNGDLFSDEEDDGFFSDDDEDDFFSDNYNERNEAEETLNPTKAETAVVEIKDDYKIPKDSVWESLSRSKAEFVNCKCQWGLFRDRNVTMRKPIQFLTGVSDLAQKGVITYYDNKNTLGWWQPGSSCDAVGGQDSSTLPPSISTNQTLDIFIDLMCRRLQFRYEKDIEHGGLRSLRFIPPENALGSHTDPDPKKNNSDNACYCMDKEGFTCFKSGVMNMEPCKRESGSPPIALSFPHFYQADPSFLSALRGLKPQKEKHEFFIDVEPTFGFPLAIRPKFQLNIVIFREPRIPRLENLEREIVLPFLWAQDGFDEPSDIMAQQIEFGITAPNKLTLLGAVILFALGGALILCSLAYITWKKLTTTTTAFPI